VLPPPLWAPVVELHVLAAQMGVFASTGVETAAAGLTAAEPTWTVPADWFADWVVPVWLGPEPFEAAEDTVACWPPLVEVQDASTQAGAFAFTGDETAAAGSTSAEPT
jgi:hypothetical protein